jgi:hypothetical protein
MLNECHAGGGAVDLEIEHSNKKSWFGFGAKVAPGDGPLNALPTLGTLSVSKDGTIPSWIDPSDEEVR